MSKHALKRNIWSKFFAIIATAALAITSQQLIAISAHAAEVDSASSPIDSYGYFDGTNKLLKANDSQVIPASTNFTAEAWVTQSRSPSTTGYYNILASTERTSTSPTIGYKQFVIQSYNNELVVWVGGQSLLTGYYFAQDIWSHIAVTVSRVTTNLVTNVYVDSNLIYTKTMAATVADPSGNYVIGDDMWVGSNPVAPAGEFWMGAIDQVKIWGGVLNQSQIAQSMHDYSNANVTTPPTLRALYDFNEFGYDTEDVYNRADTTGDLDLGATSLARNDTKQVLSGGNVDGNRNQGFRFIRTYLTSIGGWTLPDNLTAIEALVVGAGGGGGENVGSGGSGGSASYYNVFGLAGGDTLKVTVGQGGRAGTLVDDTMHYSDNTNQGWMSDGTGTLNNLVASASRDGGTGQSSQLSVSSLTMVASGGLGGQNHWVDEKCNGTVNAAVTTAANSAGSGGTTNYAGATGGAGASGLNTQGSNGSDGYSLTIGGTSYKFGAGGAGGNWTNTSYLAGGADGGGNSTDPTSRGGNGDANSGGGGAGGNAGCAPGGSGGSGVVIIRTAANTVKAISAGGGSTRVLSGVVAAPEGTYSLAISATMGTFDIPAAALAASGATRVAGTSTDKFITLRGSPRQLHKALNKIQYSLPMFIATGNLKYELNPIVADTATTFYNAANGHYYRNDATAQSYSSAKSSANNSANNLLGLNGYLATVTTSQENNFIDLNSGENSVWGGGGYNGTNWVWEDGPELNQAFWSGRPGSAIGGQLACWATGEPNGTQDKLSLLWQTGITALNAGSDSNCLPAPWDNTDAATNQRSVVEYGGRLTDPGVSIATLTVTQPSVNVAFTELNFNYTAGNYTNLNKLAVGTPTTSAGNTVQSPAVASTGKAIGDRVLFKAVTVRDGKTVDAIVTTSQIVGSTIKNYETGTGAGGAASNFETDIDIASANGYAEFQFDFYITDPNLVSLCNASTTCAGATKVRLENVNVSLIDVDYYQWNEITSIDSYTVTNPTNVKECLISSLTSSTTCTSRATISAFPADVRFQGTSAIDSTILQDQVVANYGTIDQFKVKFGRDRAGSPNYYGVAFKALSWGTTAIQTFGNAAANYNIVYNGNGSSTGTVPATQVGPVGSNYTVATNSGTLTKAGYTFGGWNTEPDGTGSSYATGSAILMPVNGLTLYAVWVPNQFTLTYDANGGSSSPASVLQNSGAQFSLSSVVPTRSGYIFGGWNTLATGAGVSYSSGANYTMPGSNTTLYAKWTVNNTSIAYNGNGNSSGAVPSTQTGTAGATTTVASNSGSLAKTGYTFAGWNTATSGAGTDYAAGASISYPASGTTTLYAKWTAVAYQLIYNSNGGSTAPASSSQFYNASVTVAAVAANPTRTGFTFAGWNTQSDGLGTNYLPSASFTMPAANTTLYAKWTANTYTVTYNGNAPSGQSVTGSQSDATSYTSGATVTVKNAGTLAVTNYRFVGWNTLADGTGTDYAAGQTLNMPAANTTLYAKWVLSTIKLTYDANGGTGAPPQDTHAGGTGILLPTTQPTRTGYTFAGWCADLSSCPSPLQPNASYTVPNVDTVLYAKWTPIYYSLFYNANGGGNAPATVLNLIVNAVVTLSNSLPTLTGFTFLGWNTLATGAGTDYSVSGLLTMAANDITLYAKWQGDPFTLTYNANGGSNMSPASEARNAGSVSNITGSTPNRSGYTFAGWNTAANGSGTAYASSASLTMPGANVTLYAQWSVVSSGVNYDANGGTGAPNGVNASFGQSVTVSATVPVRTGYTFTGWNTAANGSGTPYSANDQYSMGASSVTFYAQWTIASYLMDYDANGGTGAPGSASYNYANTVTVAATIPVRSGYDFLAWNTASTGAGTTRQGGTNFSMPASNVTLFAQWSLATFTVYYNANGGNGTIASQAGRYNTQITLSSTVPTRTGYTFNGWNTSADGNGTPYASAAAFTIPGVNTILYAQWTPITFTLSYNVNSGDSGTGPASLTGKTFGEAITLSSTVPTKTGGYYFTGWNTAANGTGSSYSSSSTFSMPAASVTLYAQWSLNTFSVSYNANGGNGAPGSQSTDGSGSVTTSATVPVRPGYTFQRWNTQVGGGGTNVSPNSTFTPGGNTVLYAQWTANTITVSYDINTGSGTVPAQQTGVYGTSIQLAGSGAFNKANYIFVSWNTLADGTGTNYQADEPIYLLPTSDITLYAIWSGTNYVIEYKPNGGSNAPADQYATPGTNVNVAPSAPSKPGFDFAYWTEVSTGNVYSPGTAIIMPTSNVVLIANWVTRASSSAPRVFEEKPTPTPSPTESGPTLPKKLAITVYFKGDSAKLTAATILALKKLVATAKPYGKASAITIIGRVKETNDKSYDARLSKQRATNVANYLRKLGITGSYKVIAAGISPENKPISRRVDATLVWNK